MTAATTTVQQLLAGASGGPAGVTEASVKGNADANANAAISQLAASAGKMNAPSAFMGAQAPQLQMPANAVNAAANTAGAGAANANGQISGAVSTYRNAVDAVKPMVQQAMKAAMENPFTGTAATDAATLLQRNYQQGHYLDAINTNQTKSTVQDTLNQAAASGMDPQQYGVLRDVLGTAKSAPEALQLLNQRVQPALNSDGSPILNANGQATYYMTNPTTGAIVTNPDTGEQLSLSGDQVSGIESNILPAYGLNTPDVQTAIGQSGASQNPAFIGSTMLPALGAIYNTLGTGTDSSGQ